MSQLEVIVSSFIQFQLSLKIYHWQTHVYSRHVASDTLHSTLSRNIDRIIEALQGMQNKRVNFTQTSPLQLQNMDDVTMDRMLRRFGEWLQDDFQKLVPMNQFILNIRDEIVCDIAQTLYLFSLH